MQKLKIDEETFDFLYNFSISGSEDYHNAKLEEISFKHYCDRGFAEEIGGDRSVLNGYYTLVQFLMEGVDVKLNQTVKKIVQQGNGKINVVTNKGDILADHVVVSVPLGVLQANTIIFEPDLPQNKKEAIATLGFGLLYKVVFYFSEAFWEKDVDWIGHASKPSGQFSWFQNFYKLTRKPMLMAFFSAEFAKQMSDLPDNEVFDKGLEILALRYGEKPKQCFLEGQRSNWSKDEFARGSYSFIKLGCTGGVNYDILAEPFGNIRFAGEATMRSHPGTVHGALFSGRREALALKTKLKEANVQKENIQKN